MTRRIAVVMTCHNRRAVTVSCLEALLESLDGVDAKAELYVTDDGSTDGTSDAIARVWPGATVIPGTGSLYWAAGMALAERAAVRGRPDYLLWLNDDTVLGRHAAAELLAASRRHPAAIIVGAVTDAETGARTYGGRIRIGGHPQRFSPLPVTDSDQPADTFNGNIVLVPWSARERVGPIDGLFAHAYADDDYGLRATSHGVPVVQARGTMGHCSKGAPRMRVAGGPVARWRATQSPIGLPWRSQVRYLRRHGGRWWPVWLVAGHVKRIIRAPA